MNESTRTLFGAVTRAIWVIFNHTLVGCFALTTIYVSADFIWIFEDFDAELAASMVLSRNIIDFVVKYFYLFVILAWPLNCLIIIGLAVLRGWGRALFDFWAMAVPTILVFVATFVVFCIAMAFHDLSSALHRPARHHEPPAAELEIDAEAI